MLKKSFVSLSFSSHKFQVLQLNSAKNKIVKFASIDLPAGQIENFKVKDKAALAATLKNVWTKLGIREKSVGIIIPEFSTFTKLFSLPKLETAELDEAVRWQAQEFLPSEPKDMVVDWKIVKRLKDKYQILVVAMDKEVLKGYVNSAEHAGLYPQVVETPSISLVRISDKDSGGKLIVYNNFGEGILIIAEEEKIFASSVVSLTNLDEIARTAKQIIGHYKEVKVEKVMIGGSRIPAELPKRLEKDIGVPVSWIKPNVSGISTENAQEYLVPISLQLKELAEPSDENTVNLLPTDLVKKYEKERIKHQIWGLTLFVTLVVWISFFTTLGFYMFFGQQIENLKQKNTLSKIPPAQAEVIEQVSKTNALADKVLRITNANIPIEPVFNSIDKARPTGISISRYMVDLETGKIEIIGTSATRQTLIDFKQQLEEVEDFSLVQIPLSSLEVESNFQFRINFSYLPIVGSVDLPGR